MLELIEAQREALTELCRKYHVRRLDVFGSALTGRFDPQRSDLDFVVDLADPPDMNRADQYFGLLFALEELFGRPVDRVCARAIRNRFFRQAIERARVTLYAA